MRVPKEDFFTAVFFIISIGAVFDSIAVISNREAAAFIVVAWHHTHVRAKACVQGVVCHTVADIESPLELL